MEYKRQPPSPARVQPRVIIHGGAGNLTPATLTPDRYRAFRAALLTIISRTHSFMTTPTTTSTSTSSTTSGKRSTLPTALEVATHAVVQLEDNPLFNAGRGAVFTRDGTNELEASVMVSRGRTKRGVGVSGLRRVRNPVLLARAVLEHGDQDLRPRPRAATTGGQAAGEGEEAGGEAGEAGLDVPSAQGHTHLHGASAEQLAEKYGLAMVEPAYFFTQRRWDEHVRGLEREKEGGGLAAWSADEFLPQGTVGAVAVDEDGVVCCATSTGGLTNKLSGRIGDTPTVGAGFWAEEWIESVDVDAGWGRTGPAVFLSGVLGRWLADCTGNGDSFLRTAAARTVGSIARYASKSSAAALSKVTGPGGELQRSAGDRWGRTGEGEGGMIGIECVVVRDAEGNVVEARSQILQDYNCGGMFRAWVDDNGVAFARVFREDQELPDLFAGERTPEDPRRWRGGEAGLDAQQGE